MFIVTLTRHRKKEDDVELAEFEQNMYITNPQMYQEYRNNKQDQIDSGNTGITWLTPETMEEAQEIEKMFADMDKRMKEKDNRAADEEFLRQVELMQQFGGIDIDQIGGD